ncbi:MAG TPA: endonuclease V [Candidatus Paceibacterota bacterium]
MNNDALRFDIAPKEAVALQKELRTQVRLVPLAKEPHIIGGCDVSMNRFAIDGFAGFVNLSYPELEMTGESVIKDRIPLPYIPGLLSFREMPMLMKAWEALAVKPDVLMVDGIGIAHPRRLGIASHLGLALGIPTIGCAKSVLTGVYDEPGIEAGSISYLRDRSDPTDIIGAAVRTKRMVAPMFISPGHLITLEDSVRLVLACVRKHRLPEPTRQAHLAVNRHRVNDARA